MMKKKMLAMLLAFCGLALTAVEAASVTHETVLTGEVVSAVAAGTAVKEGDTLVTVRTLAGPMVAARATVSGQVEQVNVTVGAKVERGQVVAVVNGQ